MKGKVWWFIHVTLRNILIHGRLVVLRHVYGMSIGKGVRISFKAKLDTTNPRGIHIGDETYIAFGAAVLSHDMSRLVHRDVVIGKCCFIGACSIILPGVTVGDHSVVGAGSVVTKDVPPNTLVAGNPAQVVRAINTKSQGVII